jgi:hypothetical protein
MRPTLRLLAFSLLTSCVAVVRAHEVPAEMVTAANALLAALTPEQKKLAVYPLTDAERENWNFVPIARNGLPFKKTSTDVQALGIELLRTGLSHTGVAKVQAVMQLEIVLKELEKANPKQNRDPVNYFVTIFGEPAADKSWGWRFEGHHLAFNFTVVEGKHVFFAPSFLGTNPAEVKAGPRKGERVLAQEEDAGHAFIASLDEAQRKLAIFDAKAPTEIATANKKRVDPLAPAGISSAQLRPEQREKLLALFRIYAGRARPELAAEVMAKVAATPADKFTFAWAGSLQRASGGSYYRLQTPDYLIEYDNTQNNANHVHSVFRDFKGDFGHDLLAEHYAKAHKK